MWDGYLCCSRISPMLFLVNGVFSGQRWWGQTCVMRKGGVLFGACTELGVASGGDESTHPFGDFVAPYGDPETTSTRYTS